MPKRNTGKNEVEPDYMGLTLYKQCTEIQKIMFGTLALDGWVVSFIEHRRGKSPSRASMLASYKFSMRQLINENTGQIRLLLIELGNNLISTALKKVTKPAKVPSRQTMTAEVVVHTVCCIWLIPPTNTRTCRRNTQHGIYYYPYD